MPVKISSQKVQKINEKLGEGLIVPILRNFGNLNSTYYSNFGSRSLKQCWSIKRMIAMAIAGG